MPDENTTTEHIKLLYEENGKNYRMFVEWRYKVLVRHFVTLGASLLLSKFLYDIESLNALAFFPVFICAVLSKLYGRMDIRNGVLFNNCKSIGASLEEKMGMKGEGFYSHLANKNSGVTYTDTLGYIYTGSFWLLLFSSIILFLDHLFNIF